MVSADRRNQLLELVRQQGYAQLPDLAKQLSVSESTIRRDLAHLEQQGLARRTHGGAFYSGPSPKLTHFDRRQSRQWDKKRAIAHRARRIVEENDTILLDGGSTTYELARLLAGMTLQVVTNSLPVANLFSSVNSADLIIVGGYVHGRTGTIQGSYAVDLLRTLSVRRTIISGAAVNERGLFNNNLQCAEVDKTMLEVGQEITALVDSTKFGNQSLAHVCDLDQLDRVVVDDGLPDHWRARLEDAGVDVLIAPLLDDAEGAQRPGPPAGNATQV